MQASETRKAPAYSINRGETLYLFIGKHSSDEERDDTAAEEDKAGQSDGTDFSEKDEISWIDSETDSDHEMASSGDKSKKTELDGKNKFKMKKSESSSKKASSAEDALKILLGQKPDTSSVPTSPPLEKGQPRTGAGYYRLRASHRLPYAMDKKESASKAPIRKSLDDALKKIADSRQRLSKLVSLKPKEDEKKESSSDSAPKENSTSVRNAINNFEKAAAKDTDVKPGQQPHSTEERRTRRTRTTDTNIADKASTRPKPTLPATSPPKPTEEQSSASIFVTEAGTVRENGTVSEGKDKPETTVNGGDSTSSVPNSEAGQLEETSLSKSVTSSAHIVVTAPSSESAAPPTESAQTTAPDLPSSAPPPIPSEAPLCTPDSEESGSSTSSLSQTPSEHVPELPQTSPPPPSPAQAQAQQPEAAQKEVKTEVSTLSFSLSSSEGSKASSISELHQESSETESSTKSEEVVNSTKPEQVKSSETSEKIQSSTEQKSAEKPVVHEKKQETPVKEVRRPHEPIRVRQIPDVPTNIDEIVKPKTPKHNQESFWESTQRDSIETESRFNEPAPRIRSPVHAEPPSLDRQQALRTIAMAEANRRGEPLGGSDSRFSHLFSGGQNFTAEHIRNKLRETHVSSTPSTGPLTAEMIRSNLRETHDAERIGGVIPKGGMDDLHHLVHADVDTVGAHRISVDDTMSRLDTIRKMRQQLASKGSGSNQLEPEEDVTERYAKTEQKVQQEIDRLKERAIRHEVLLIEKSMEAKEDGLTPDGAYIPPPRRRISSVNDAGTQSETDGKAADDEDDVKADHYYQSSRKAELEHTAQKLDYFRHKQDAADNMCNAKIDRLLSGVGKRYNDYQSEVLNNYISPSSNNITLLMYGSNDARAGRMSERSAPSGRYRRTQSYDRSRYRSGGAEPAAPQFYARNPFDV